MAAWIHGFGCTTAAGETSDELFSALLEGRDCRSWVDTANWPGQGLVKTPQVPRAFLWNARLKVSGPDLQVKRRVFGDGTIRALLTQQLLLSWQETSSMLSPEALQRLRAGHQLGVILASTKSFVDDFIWDDLLEESPEKSAEDSPEKSAEESLGNLPNSWQSEWQEDPLSLLLKDFVALANLKPARQVAVSNACASSISALALAESWLQGDEITDVLVIAADAVGPFVIRGFETLRVLTPDAVRSFSKDRSGFHLGDAAASLVLSNHKGSATYSIRGAGVDAEGFAVTRPAQSGTSLNQACLSIDRLIEDPPELILAHGTGTKVNDQIEDHVYHEMFGHLSKPPLITATKWCVGHTLGACGLVDVIASLKILQHQKVFRMAMTDQVDLDFKNHYLTAQGAPLNQNGEGIASVEPRADTRYLMETGLAELNKILVCSLGFGGIHAAVLVERVP